MTVSLDLMNNKQIRRAVTAAGCVIGGLVVVKLVSKAADAAHERKQNKEIRRLKKEVEELQERVDELEGRKSPAEEEKDEPKKKGLFVKRAKE